MFEGLWRLSLNHFHFYQCSNISYAGIAPDYGGFSDVTLTKNVLKWQHVKGKISAWFRGKLSVIEKVNMVKVDRWVSVGHDWGSLIKGWPNFRGVFSPPPLSLSLSLSLFNIIVLILKTSGHTCVHIVNLSAPQYWLSHLFECFWKVMMCTDGCERVGEWEVRCVVCGVWGGGGGGREWWFCAGPGGT